jgi:hypothetical protein
MTLTKAVTPVFTVRVGARALSFVNRSLYSAAYFIQIPGSQLLIGTPQTISHKDRSRLLNSRERKACHAALQPKLAALHVIGRHLLGRYLTSAPNDDRLAGFFLRAVPVEGAEPCGAAFRGVRPGAASRLIPLWIRPASARARSVDVARPSMARCARRVRPGPSRPKSLEVHMRKQRAGRCVQSC